MNYIHALGANVLFSKKNQFIRIYIHVYIFLFNDIVFVLLFSAIYLLNITCIAIWSGLTIRPCIRAKYVSCHLLGPVRQTYT